MNYIRCLVLCLAQNWHSIKVSFCCYDHVPGSQTDTSLKTQDAGHRAMSDSWAQRTELGNSFVIIFTKTVTHKG